MRTCRATSIITMEELLELLRVPVVLLLGCSGCSCGRDPIGILVIGPHSYWLIGCACLHVAVKSGTNIIVVRMWWLKWPLACGASCLLFVEDHVTEASQARVSLQRAPLNPRHQHVLQGTGHIAAKYRQRWSRPCVRSCRCLVKQSRRIMCSVVFVNNKTSGHGRGGRRRVGMGQGPQGF